MLTALATIAALRLPPVASPVFGLLCGLLLASRLPAAFPQRRPRAPSFGQDTDVGAVINNMVSPEHAVRLVPGHDHGRMLVNASSHHRLYRAATQDRPADRYQAPCQAATLTAPVDHGRAAHQVYKTDQQAAMNPLIQARTLGSSWLEIRHLVFASCTKVVEDIVRDPK